MRLKDKFTRIQADYTLEKHNGDMFTVFDDNAESGAELKFTREAENVLPNVKRGSTAFFRFFANDESDDFTLEIYNASGEMVDALYTSDLQVIWQFALLGAIHDLARPGGMIE